MPSATITLKTKADADVVMTLVGQTPTSAEYKLTSRSLSVPKTMTFKYQLGNPGSLGNDKVFVEIKDSAQNATTGLVKTLGAKLELSIPRDAAITVEMVEDILCHYTSLLTDTNAEKLAAGTTP